MNGSSAKERRVRDTAWQPWAVAAVLLLMIAAGAYDLLVLRRDKPHFELRDGRQVHVLRLWEWDPARTRIIQKYLDRYHEHTGGRVEVRATQIAWDQYWSKVVAACVGGKPPTMMNMHNTMHTKLVDLLEPYPQDLFPLEEMNRRYFWFDLCFVHEDRSGQDQFYYLPSGLMTGMVFYNRDVWELHGLTEEDYPETWDELFALGRELTVRDARGEEIRVAGFNFNLNMFWLLTDLIYQRGGRLYAEDGEEVLFASPEARQGARLLCRTYEQGSCTPRFLGFLESFTSYESENRDTASYSAMGYAWGWVGSYLRAQNPAMRWGVFPLPHVAPESGNPLLRTNSECAQAVMAGAPAEDKAEAFLFLKWLHEQDDYLLETNLEQGTLPCKMALWEDPDVDADPVVSVIRSVVRRAVIPGELPERMLELMLGLEDLLAQGMPLDDALDMANRVGNINYKENPSRWLVESESIRRASRAGGEL